MNIIDIRNRAAFVEWIKKNIDFEKMPEDSTPESAADWFVARTNAEAFSDMNTREIGRVLLEGIKGVSEDPEEAHAAFWEVWWMNSDDDPQYQDDDVLTLEGAFRRHFADAWVEQ